MKNAKLKLFLLMLFLIIILIAFWQFLSNTLKDRQSKVMLVKQNTQSTIEQIKSK